MNSSLSSISVPIPYPHGVGNGMEDPRVFDLKQLDTDQWCEAMKAAGMKMVIFTAKHHDGFVLWQSRYTRHGIMSTDFREGKGIY